MRVKRQKKNRRTVRFFTVCFGFRQPYKVLCDGTFVHHLVTNEITPADTTIADLLGGPVKLFTTKCVLAELQKLGKDFVESLEAAQMLSTATCEHEEAKAADECLLEVIGNKNTEHFFLGTQDAEFRKKLQQESIVPLVFGLRNILLIDPPSDFQRQTAKTSEKRRLNMTETDKKKLEIQTEKIIASIKGTDEDEQWETQRVANSRNGLSVKDKPQFKRKRAKGPNPLSCMKKKKDTEKPQSKPKAESKSKSSAQKVEISSGTKRKRKRSKHGKSGSEKTE